MGISDAPRQLLIFAPDSVASKVHITRRRIDGSRDESEERDLQVRYLLGAREEAAEARARWNVDSGESVALLIGRDGGVKLRTGLPVDTDKIFALIDTMPMRRREMAEKLSESDR